MGVVYLAEHPVIGKKVAMKAIHPELSQELRRRLALHHRGEGGQPDRSRAHRRHRRLRQHAGGRVLLRDGVPAGRVAVRPPQAREADSAGPGDVDRRADRRRAQRLAPAGHHPPRPQAREHLPLPPRREPRVRQGARLRPRQADPERPEGDPQDPHRLGDGHAVLHVPRAVRGEDRDRLPRRHLLARRADLRDADRQGPVRRRGLRRDHRQARDDAAAVGPQRRPRAARVHGPDHVPGAGQGSRPAVPDHGRPARGAARSRALRQLRPRDRHPRRPVRHRPRRGADGARRAGAALGARAPLADPHAATARRHAVGPRRADREHRQPDPDPLGEPPRPAAGAGLGGGGAVRGVRAPRHPPPTPGRRACRSTRRPCA